MRKRYTVGFFMFMSTVLIYGQNKALKFAELEDNGISQVDIDAQYAGAIHHDPSLAVFKTEAEQKALIEAYTKIYQDLSAFLTAHNFEWDKEIKIFNRVYFKENGTIDYLVYKSIGDENLTEEQDVEFQRLLNLFVAEYQIEITANEKFAQCSPITLVSQKTVN